MLPPLVRSLAWATAYLVAGELGLLTAPEGRALPLATPAVGVGLVWIALGDRRSWPLDAALIGLVSALLTSQLGLPALVVAANPVVSLLQFVVTVALIRRFTSDLGGLRGPHPVWRLRELLVVTGAIALGTLLTAGAGTGVQALAGLDTGSWDDFALRWARNAISMATIGLAALLVVGWWRRTRGKDRRPSGRSVTELGALVALSGLSFTLVFVEDLPLSFLLFAPTIWLAVRFPPVVIALHSAVVGAVTLVLTLRGIGLFAGVDDQQTSALVAQLFVILVSLTGQLIGVSRGELTATQAESQGRSRLLERVLAEIHDGVALVDEQGRLLVVNRAARELVLVQQDLATTGPGATYAAFEPDGSQLTHERLPHLRAFAGDEVSGEEVRVCPPDQPERLLLVNGHVLPPLAEGEPRTALVSFHDVTAERRRAAALSTFAAEVAHDLKNPLSVVEGWAEALVMTFQDGDAVPPEVGIPMAERVISGARHMRGFIDDLLVHTVVRDQVLAPVPTDLAALARLVADLRTEGAEAGQAPEITVGDSALGVFADPGQLRILLDNLIGNAVKYVAPGERPRIHVSLRPAEQPGALPGDWVEVLVADNGLGVPAADRTRVFESLARVDRPGYQGTGLGLAMCHRIVTRHGGTIRVEDNPGGGSLFRFTLPTSETALAG